MSYKNYVRYLIKSAEGPQAYGGGGDVPGSVTRLLPAAAPGSLRGQRPIDPRFSSRASNPMTPEVAGIRARIDATYADRANDAQTRKDMYNGGEGQQIYNASQTGYGSRPTAATKDPATGQAMGAGAVAQNAKANYGAPVRAAVMANDFIPGRSTVKNLALKATGALLRSGDGPSEPATVSALIGNPANTQRSATPTSPMVASSKPAVPPVPSYKPPAQASPTAVRTAMPSVPKPTAPAVSATSGAPPVVKQGSLYEKWSAWHDAYYGAVS